MKNKYKIIVFLFYIGLSSCDNQLDLAPTDVLIEKDVFATKEKAEQALADVYYKLFLASSGTTHSIADISLSYVGIKTVSSYSNYFSGTLTSSDQEVEKIWQKCYEAINVANVFINKIPIFGKYDESIKKQHIAEAKFSRAYAYLILLSYYGHKSLTNNPKGLCVPLQLTPYDGFTPSDLIARNTNEEVYNQISKDASEAVLDLPEAYETSLKTRARATKATANALLSRVQLYKRDYIACINASNEVLKNTNYNLDSDLKNLFPLNTEGTTSTFSNEVIFGFPVSSNGGNFQYGTHGIGYFHKYQWVTRDFINSMESNDKRKTELIFKGNPNVTDQLTKFEKTTFKFNNPDLRDDLQMIRLAEVLLNKAEALAQLDGVNSESISILNRIRQRSGLTAVAENGFNTKKALLEALYNERYIETAFEGRGRFDFIRTERPLRNSNLTENKKTFPIPQREIDLSQGILVQNPGYN